MSKSPVAVAPVQLNLGDGVPYVSAKATAMEVLGAAREHAVRILATTLGAAVALAALGLLLPRLYETSTRILIDPRGLQLVDKDVSPRAGSSDQSVSIVESEMRVLYSDNVLRAVVDHAGLARDREFNGDDSVLAKLAEKVRVFAKTLAGVREEPTPPDLAALRYLQKAIKVRREPQSYVIDLSVTTRDPVKSQQIADRIAEEYVQTRFAGQAAATKRASETMAGRLDALRQAVVTAEDAVERFKSSNNIVGASGRLINEQQLAELNSQLVVARNDAIKAADLFEQVTRLRRSGGEPDALPEALKSETLVRLRTQYAAIRRREASLSVSVLPNHPALRQVTKELADTRKLISDELGRIAENTKLESERAKANERTLERSLEDLKKQATGTNEKMVRLRELEREAEAHRSVYNSFLTRSRELAEQTRIDSALATVLSPAIPPRGPKAPTTIHLLGLGAFGGLAFGLYSALQRNRRNPRLRGDSQLRALTGSRRILTVPRLSDAVRSGTTSRIGADGSVPEVPMFVLTDPDQPASLAFARLSAELNAKTFDDRPLVLLVTASGEYEGKSTVAVNAALAAALAGDRVLLVDADQRGRMSSGIVDGGKTRPGLFDGATNGDVADFIVKPAQFPIDVLPVGHRSERRLGRLGPVIASLSRRYDLVVIDAGVLIRDRYVAELAATATHIALVARDGVTVKAEYQGALEILDRGGKVRPVLITDA